MGPPRRGYVTPFQALGVVIAVLSGGDKLERALAEITLKLKQPGTLRVGFLEGATYPSTPTKQLRTTYAKRTKKGTKGAVKGSPGGKPVAMIAAIQEFGTGRIPPRPFFRNAIAKYSKNWAKGIATQLKATNYDTRKTLMITGEVIAGQIRQSIIETNSPPLSPTTIARKGFSKPLIDTSHMINSVNYEVRGQKK